MPRGYYDDFGDYDDLPFHLQDSIHEEDFDSDYSFEDGEVSGYVFEDPEGEDFTFHDAEDEGFTFHDEKEEEVAEEVVPRVEGYKPDGNIDPKSERWKGMSPNQILDARNKDVESGLIQGTMTKSGPSHDVNAQGAGVSREADLKERQKELKKKHPSLTKAEIFEKAQSEQMIDGVKEYAKMGLSVLPVGRGLLGMTAMGGLVGGASELADQVGETVKGNQDFLTSDTAKDVGWESLKSGALGAAFGALPGATKLARGFTKDMDELVKEGSKTVKAKESVSKIKKKGEYDAEALRPHREQIYKTEEAVSAIKEMQELKKHDKLFQRVDTNASHVAENIDNPELKAKFLKAAPLSSKLSASATKAGEKAVTPTLSGVARAFSEGKTGEQVAEGVTGYFKKGLSNKLGLTSEFSKHSKELAAARRYTSQEGSHLTKEVPEAKTLVKALKKGDFSKADDEYLKLMDSLKDSKKSQTLDDFYEGLEMSVDMTSKKKGLSQVVSDNWLTALAASAEPTTAVAREGVRKYTSGRNNQYLRNSKKALEGDKKFAEQYKQAMAGKNGPILNALNLLSRGELEELFK